MLLVVVGGIGVGVFIMYRARSKKSEPVLEVPTAQYAVASAQDTQVNDETQRALTAAIDKQRELEDKQRQAQDDYARALADQERTRGTERDEFNARLIAQQQQLASQYGSQLAQLEATIQRLQAQIEAERARTPVQQPITNPVMPVQQPIGNPITPVQQPIERPTPNQPVQSGPNVPGGYPTDCSGVGPARGDAPQGTDENTIKAWLAAYRRKEGASEASAKWRAVWFALGGATGRANLRTWINLYLTDAWLPNLNKTRRANGLKALTMPEMETVRINIRGEIARQGSRDDISANFIGSLFKDYYFPYLCASGVRR